MRTHAIYNKILKLRREVNELMLSFSVNAEQTSVVKFQLNSEVKNASYADGVLVIETEDGKQIKLNVNQDALILKSSHQFSVPKTYL
ncbi:hypothetical protein ACW7EJ_20515 [Acinetobacter soli]